MFETVSYDALKVNDEFNAFGTGNPSGKGTGQIAKFLKGCLAAADPAMDQVVCSCPSTLGCCPLLPHPCSDPS